MTTREKTYSLANEAGLSVKFMTVAEIEALARFHILVIAAHEREPQKARPDFIAGYDAGMADAKRLEQLREVETPADPAAMPD